LSFIVVPQERVWCRSMRRFASRTDHSEVQKSTHQCCSPALFRSDARCDCREMTSKAVSEGPVRSLRFVVRSIAIAAVLIANFAWASQSTQSLSVADARLSRVITAFNNASTGKSGKDGYERAIAEAQKIKNEYGSSPAARIAQYYIALSEEN